MTEAEIQFLRRRLAEYENVAARYRAAVSETFLSCASAELQWSSICAIISTRARRV